MAALRDLLRRGAAQLQAAGVPSPEVDARALLVLALNLSPTALLTRGHEPAPPGGQARYEALLARRAARVPLQHLLGEVEWGGVRLRTDARALVPRPETEWLLHLVLQALAGREPPRVLDVGTGTGALALGLKAARPDAQVSATDLSEEALSLARENAALNGLNVSFMAGDLLAGLTGPFDLIVSNPPYLPETDAQAAQPEVTFDPPLALYGGPDGLAVARRLAGQAGATLAPGGELLLELDPRNAAPFAAELRAQDWQATTAPDLAGRERFVLAQRAP
ncbi:peptide chain release factor N(5)-glutamine methyltransferase [Deinococcus multiflagellatus]|uniref:peptide chain release factor N(5)-glutamine methyltransferase n=1 Tax=Deinococcus multiflagellatus TaxID=1656887 RepID=UPI001CCE14B1|nr:peptide chain release factor N(5)-glutamine methyltransferase [Deinococcus multiflagellatus]MBZ9712366.1 peptide chain release factor N(5)-glutamine methyltransferase [Deinococcus multiflagellatus]